ncbi:MAG: hypothetical protein CO036_03030, partial [Candidatus Omnitrophica bacterium CG_4_9_14_0_2_um_filter_43_12]
FASTVTQPDLLLNSDSTNYFNAVAASVNATTETKDINQYEYDSAGKQIKSVSIHIDDDGTWSANSTINEYYGADAGLNKGKLHVRKIYQHNFDSIVAQPLLLEVVNGEQVNSVFDAENATGYDSVTIDINTNDYNDKGLLIKTVTTHTDTDGSKSETVIDKVYNDADSKLLYASTVKTDYDKNLNVVNRIEDTSKYYKQVGSIEPGEGEEVTVVEIELPSGQIISVITEVKLAGGNKQTFSDSSHVVTDSDNNIVSASHTEKTEIKNSNEKLLSSFTVTVNSSRDASGNLVDKTTSNSIVNIYDDDRLTDTVTTDTDADGKVTVVTEHKEYDGSNSRIVSSVKIKTEDGTQIEKDVVINTYYESSHNLKESITTHTNKDSSYRVTTESKEYDPLNKNRVLHTEKKTEEFTAENVLKSTQTEITDSEYDLNGKLHNFKSQTIGFDGSIKQTLRDYENGKLVSDKTIETAADGSQKIQETISEYSVTGSLIRSTTVITQKNIDGTDSTVTEIRHYDRKGQVANDDTRDDNAGYYRERTWSEYKDGEKITYTEKDITTYTYDSNGRLERSEMVHTYPDGATDTAVEIKRYKADGGLTYSYSKQLLKDDDTGEYVKGKTKETETVYSLDSRVESTVTTIAYPDGTTDVTVVNNSYTPSGKQKQIVQIRTRRDGTQEITTTAYDALGRAVSVLTLKYSDSAHTALVQGSLKENTYDLKGRVASAKTTYYLEYISVSNNSIKYVDTLTN